MRVHGHTGGTRPAGGGGKGRGGNHMGRTGTLRDVAANDDPNEHTLTPGSSAYGHVIERLVARGGCGSVYLARHRSTGRPVAVKVLHPNLAPLPKMIERF